MMRAADLAILLPAIGLFAVASPAQAANTRPVILGTPATTVATGRSYSFTPTAYDADGDALVFSIKNRPAWATFSTKTGRLSGTPMPTHEGTWPQIVISVTDGKSLPRSLPAFGITVLDTSARLSWSPPVSNVDGSPLADLAGYRIVYGLSPGSLTKLKVVKNPKTTATWVYGLTPGTWYFAVKAYNTAGVESDVSNLAQKTID